MEAGNPKQVAVLSVVAVLAIGFLVTRMRGNDLPKIAQAIVDKATGRAAVMPPSYPMVSDPFSHPKLAVTQAVATTTGTEAEKPMMPPFLVGELPPAGERPLPANVPSGEIGQTTTEPLKPAEPKTEKAVPEGTEILLEATAGATDTVAFISIGGAESQPFHANDFLKSASFRGKVRLLRVDDGAIVLSGPKGELTIGVGERKRI